MMTYIRVESGQLIYNDFSIDLSRVRLYVGRDVRVLFVELLYDGETLSHAHLTLMAHEAVKGVFLRNWVDLFHLFILTA